MDVRPKQDPICGAVVVHSGLNTNMGRLQSCRGDTFSYGTFASIVPSDHLAERSLIWSRRLLSKPPVPHDLPSGLICETRAAAALRDRVVDDDVVDDDIDLACCFWV